MNQFMHTVENNNRYVNFLIIFFVSLYQISDALEGWWQSYLISKQQLRDTTLSPVHELSQAVLPPAHSQWYQVSQGILQSRKIPGYGPVSAKHKMDNLSYSFIYFSDLTCQIIIDDVVVAVVVLSCTFFQCQSFHFIAL